MLMMRMAAGSQKTEQIRMDAKTPLKVMETCYAYESMERLTEENYHTASGAWKIWRSDSRKHASPNSAQTESACAGSLGIQLAGDASYFGKTVKKPTIGDALRPVKPEDIRCANVLLYRMAFLGMAVCLSLLYFL